MATVIDHPPVSTPADEWAASTESALTSKSQTATNTIDTSDGPSTSSTAHSLASTPGLELPGAFPRELHFPFTSVSAAPSSKSGAEAEAERTPGAALEHLADAAPPKTTADLQETARGYMPDVQAALETARGYLPQAVVNVFPGASSTTATETETEAPTPKLTPTDKLLNATSGAKPGNTSSVDIDLASTTALPPSTRNGSYTTDFSDSSAGKSLDPTSTAKLADSAAGPVAVTSIPGADSSHPAATPLPFTHANASSFPTPPDSKAGTPAATETETAGGKGKNTNTQDEFPLPRLRQPSESASTTNATPPIPPPKSKAPNGDSEDAQDYADADATKPTRDQPGLSANANPTPAQAHVTSGAGVRARVPGTAPVSGTGMALGETPAASLTSVTSQVDPNENSTSTSTSGVGGGGGGGSGGSGEKKETGLSKFVHKIKDKLHHGKEGSQ